MSTRHAQLTPGLGGMHPAVLNRRIHDLLILALTVLTPLVIGLAITVAYPDPDAALVFGVIIGAVGFVSLLISTRYELTLTLLVLYLGLLDGPVKLESASAAASGVRDILIIAIGLGMVMRLIVRREHVGLPPLSGWVVAFVAFVLIGALNPHTDGLVKTLGGYRQQLEWVPFFFFAYLMLRSKQRFRQFFLILGVIALANGVVGAVQARLSPGQLASWGPGYRELATGGEGNGITARTYSVEGVARVRPPALGSDAGFGGGIGTVALPCLLALLAANPLRRRWPILILCAGAVLGIATAASRTSIVIAAIGLVSFVLLSFLAGLRVSRQLTALVVMAVLVIGVGAALVAADGSAIFSRQESLTSVQRTEETGGNGKERSLGQIPSYLVDAPFGFGLGTTGSVSGFGGSKRLEVEGERVIGGSAYSLLMKEMGAPGLLLWIGLTVSAIGLALTRLQTPARRRAAHLPRGSACRFHRAHDSRSLRTDAGSHRGRVPVGGAGRDRVLVRRSRLGAGRAAAPRSEPHDSAWRRGRAVIGRREEQSDGPSMASRLSVLLGERRSTVVWLALTSLVSGFAEAGTLALIAEVAAGLVNGKKRAHINAGIFHLAPGIGTLIEIAFVLALVRLIMQIPISILPARIAADVQASLRTKLFYAFTTASWEVQSRDREGQLQDTMTTQTMQATGGAMGATSLLTSGLNFLTLIVTAFLLNVAAAAAILVVAVLIFAVLRPLKTLGVRRARALSKAQVRYASGINEAIRVAEETQVFGVAEAQRSRIDVLVARARDLLFSTQLLTKIVPNLFQSLIFILVVVGLGVLHALGGHHNTAALGAIILLLVRSARSGQQGMSTYQGLSQSLPFIERTQEAERRYAQSAPVEGQVPLRERGDARVRERLLRLPGRSPGAGARSASTSRAARSSASSARRARASRR